ncbi:hypothetical protein [Roseovarius sp.]|uniref:hypothetical protein n=1 Tax=Roseovarius sp. TaxID=1486281 RepID=UPI003A97E82A
MISISQSPRLPGHTDWRFDDIAAQEPERAEALERSGDSTALVAALENAVEEALLGGGVRYGWELSDAREAARAVVQVPVTPPLFDWFFSGRSGYRAHYWVGCAEGEAFNDKIVDALKQKLLALGPAHVSATILGKGFVALRGEMMPLSTLAGTLMPGLAKTWLCGRLITPEGMVVENLTGSIPRLNLTNKKWPAFYQDDAWLELKGAFVGDGEPFQPKLPEQRCNTLCKDGTA